MQIHELTELSDVSTLNNNHVLAIDTGTVTRKIKYNNIAKATIENYNGSTIGGKAQTLQSAINAIATVLDGAETRKTFNGSTIIAHDTCNDSIDSFTLNGKCVQTGTPTPTTRPAINVAGSSGNIGVVCVGKNLVNLSALTATGASISNVNASTGRITVTASGTSRYAGAYGYQLHLVSGVTYRMSGKVAAINGGYAQAAIRTGDGVIKASSTANQLGAFSFSFTPDANDWIVTLFASWDNSALTGSVTYSDIQIEVGATATGFEQYTSTVVTLPMPSSSSVTGLPGIPVPDGGNYTDESGQQWICDTIDKATGTYVKRIGKVVWDGSNDENWVAQSGWSLPGYTIDVPDSAVQTNANLPPNVLCNGLIPVSTLSSFGEKDCIVSVNNVNPTYQVAVRGHFEDFRAYLGDTETDNTITMLYPLATPVITALTSAQITALNALHSYDGGTTVYTTDTLKPEFTVKPFVNIGKYL